MVMKGFVEVFVLTELRMENDGNSLRIAPTAWRRRVGDKMARNVEHGQQHDQVGGSSPLVGSLFLLLGLQHGGIIARRPPGQGS